LFSLQLGDKPVIELSSLEEKWKHLCLPKDTLDDLLRFVCTSNPNLMCVNGNLSTEDGVVTYTFNHYYMITPLNNYDKNITIVFKRYNKPSLYSLSWEYVK
jgi:hypothetical protein